MGSVSDPLLFLTDPDPTQKPKADPDAGVKGKADFFSSFFRMILKKRSKNLN